MVGEACLPSNAYYPRTPDYTLYSGVHVCWSEHFDSSFVYGFKSLDYGLGIYNRNFLIYLFSGDIKILNEYSIIIKYRFIIKFVRSSSPYTKSFCVVFLTLKLFTKLYMYSYYYFSLTKPHTSEE